MITEHVDQIIQQFTTHGDIAHLALGLWAISSTLFCVYMLKVVHAANDRFSNFIAELANLTAVLNQNTFSKSNNTK